MMRKIALLALIVHKPLTISWRRRLWHWQPPIEMQRL